ncbi:hypothetical protein ACVWWJ_001913 [Luteibacter sp. HA06]|jgi:hypothetical protein
MAARQGWKIVMKVEHAAESITAFEELASAAGYQIEVDKPSDEKAEWFIDVQRGEFRESLSWQFGRGFGFYTGELGYGDKPDRLYLDATQAFERLRHCRAALIDV